MGCDHCSHPLWAGIKCSQCGRWYDECRTCGKRGCEECMKAGLKQAWENYQEALKEFDCPRCGHNCRREWQGLTEEDLSVCDEDGVILARYWEGILNKQLRHFATLIEERLQHSLCREWQKLTDTEIGMEYVKWDATPGVSMADFARAIEQAVRSKNK